MTNYSNKSTDVIINTLSSVTIHKKASKSSSTPVYTHKYLYTQTPPEIDAPIFDYSMSMKWYNFLVCFGLFAFAVLNTLLAAVHFTGFIRNSVGTAYEKCPGLRFCDIIIGILMLGVAALAIYVRIALVKHENNAALLIAVLFATFAVLNIMECYYISQIANGVLHIGIVSVISIFSGFFLAVSNYNYFKEREHYFSE